MHHHSETQNKAPVSFAGESRLSRSIVLRSNDDRVLTIGFPAIQNDRPKRVWFDPPRPAICTLDGGAVCTDCLVLSIWDGGARLRIEDPSVLTEFDLLFASGPRPVRRRCKRLMVRGNVMDVEFKRNVPSYVMESVQDG
jgi:hypothetical protein